MSEEDFPDVFLFDSPEQRELIKEAGFEPDWAKDIRDGDVIILLHHRLNPDKPIEMIVNGVWFDYENQVARWIGVLPNLDRVHVAIMFGHPIWKLTRKDAASEEASADQVSKTVL